MNFLAKKEAQGLKKIVQTQQLNNYKSTRGLKASISSRTAAVVTELVLKGAHEILLPRPGLGVRIYIYVVDH